MGTTTRCKCDRKNECELPEKDRIHLPVMCSIVIVDGNGTIVKEATLSCGESNKDSIKNGCRKAIDYLISIEQDLVDYMHLDLTPPPSETDMDRFYNTTKCVVCERDFIWSQDTYSTNYEQDLIERNLLGERRIYDKNDENLQYSNKIVHHHHWQR